MSRRDATTSAEKPRVLVVDDDPDLREVLRRVLEPGYEVYLAANIPEAEEMLTRHEHIRVILCDQFMPGGTGLEYFRRLHRRASPPVRVLMTGEADLDLAVQAVNDRSLFYCLEKPFSSSVVLQVMGDAEREYRNQMEVREARRVSEETARQPRTERQRFWQRCRMVVALAGLALVSLLVVLVVLFVLGIVVLLMLYFFKSALGIDIFADKHLSDFL